MTKTIAIAQEVPFLGGDWFDPLEAGVRRRIRSFIEGMLEEELAAALGRGRYDRSPGAAGYRNGHRDRQLLGTFGPVAVSVPRARLSGGALVTQPAVDVVAALKSRPGSYGRWSSRVSGRPEVNGELPVAVLAEEILKEG